MRTLIARAAVLALLASCGTDEPDPLLGSATTDVTAPLLLPETTTVTAGPTEDPYELYLSMAPTDAPDISRDDAQLRAMLGCGVDDWAPGSVDAILAVAYSALIEDWKAEGLCA